MSADDETTMPVLLVIAMIAMSVMLISRCGWLYLKFFVGVVKLIVECFVLMTNMMAFTFLLHFCFSPS